MSCITSVTLPCHAAYGSVSYLRAVNAEGKIRCTLLLGKSRLAPIRQMTIPRL